MFKNEADFKELVKWLNIDDKANPAHRESLRRQMLSAFNESAQQNEPHVKIFLLLRRTIMQSKIIKLAIAAAIIIAVLIGINQLIGPIESTAFANVMENIQNAQTLTYQSVITQADKEPQVAKTMVLEPHLMRVELSDGKVWILDHGQGKKTLL